MNKSPKFFSDIQLPYQDITYALQRKQKPDKIFLIMFRVVKLRYEHEACEWNAIGDDSLCHSHQFLPFSNINKQKKAQHFWKCENK